MIFGNCASHKFLSYRAATGIAGWRNGTVIQASKGFRNEASHR